MNCLPSARGTSGTDVDVRSCILSLIDLYSHWLSQPIHTLLLATMLRSIIMLSDLFALVESLSLSLSLTHTHTHTRTHQMPLHMFPSLSQAGQFDWMLGTLLGLYENHPPEDTLTSPLIVLGLLKACAVLKLVSNMYPRTCMLPQTTC